MTYRHIAIAKSLKAVFIEHLIYQTQIFIIIEQSIIVHYDAATFLSTVLKRIQSHICLRGYIAFFIGVNAEYPTFFMNIVKHLFITSVGILSMVFRRRKPARRPAMPKFIKTCKRQGAPHAPLPSQF